MAAPRIKASRIGAISAAWPLRVRRGGWARAAAWLALAAPLAMVLIVAGGCSGPTVSLEYVLPGALGDSRHWALASTGPFEVHAPASAGRHLDEHLSAELAGRLPPIPSPADRTGAMAADSPALTAQPGATAADPAAAIPIRISGSVYVVHDDAVARRDMVGGADGRRSVESLRRRVDARVVFDIGPAGVPTASAAAGREFGAPIVVEIARAYDSFADDEVWGRLGLGRHDDPARVPPADEVAAALLRQCAEGLAEMFQPARVSGQFTMRGGHGSSARAGLRSMREGRFADAAEAFQAAIDGGRDDAATLFNAAAALEADGRPHEALESYRLAWAKGCRADDTEAAIRRLEGVTSRPVVLVLLREVR